MFMAYEITKQLIGSLRAPVVEIQKSDRELADQIYRAANSVLLNLGEGQKFQDGTRLPMPTRSRMRTGERILTGFRARYP
jgi:hypothetical protein